MSRLPLWREEPVGRTHVRDAFDSGSAPLDQYLARFARQNHESGVSKTFVAVPIAEPTRIMGYYSLSASQVEAEQVPPSALRRRGGYPIPVVLLGRLAVDRRWQGAGLGGDLFLRAAERVLAVSEEVGVRAIAIDAKDERAAGWYVRFGAAPLLDRPLTLLLPLETIRRANAEARNERDG